MTWQVVSSVHFESWWQELSRQERNAIDRVIFMLRRSGPTLSFPYSSGIIGSQYSAMRELRAQYKGKPYRVLYAFDPERKAVLLVGGIKSEDKRWYERYIQKADKIFTEYLDNFFSKKDQLCSSPTIS